MIKKILIGFVVFIVFMLIIGFIAGEDTTQEDAKSTPAEVVSNEVASTKAAPEVEPTEKVSSESAPFEEDADEGQLTEAKRAKIIEYFKGDDEPSVIDAIFHDATLKLGVHPDGSNRDGYAEYACQVLQSDFGVKELVVVRIIDIDKLVSTDKWEIIGEANCNY